MKYKNLIIEKKEYVLLKRLINLSEYDMDKTMRESVKKLLGELGSAQILDEASMPNDVIRLNSTVTISSDKGWQNKFKLVMPVHSDIKNHKVSILTPMGAAVIGYSEGDTFCWKFPSCKMQLTLETVEQESEKLEMNMAL